MWTIFNTEISYIKNQIIIFLLLQLGLMIYGIWADFSLIVYMCLSIVVFYGVVIFWSLGLESEKRVRVFSQLPVTDQQIHSGLSLVLYMLLVLIIPFWLVLFIVGQEQLSVRLVLNLISTTLGILTFIALVSIFFDLGYYKSKLWQWVYGVALFSGMVFLSDSNILPQGDSDAVVMYPAMLLWGLSGDMVAVLAILTLAALFAERWVFLHRSSYLV